MEESNPPISSPPDETPDFDHLTTWQFIRSYFGRIVGLWAFTTGVLITSLALLQVPIWKGALASLALTLATLGKKLGKTKALMGHLSRHSLDVAMADSVADIEGNYALQQPYNFQPLQDQPKGY